MTEVGSYGHSEGIVALAISYVNAVPVAELISPLYLLGAKIKV